MKNRTNSCKKWLAVLLSVSMLPTAILQNGSMAYAEEKKQEEEELTGMAAVWDYLKTFLIIFCVVFAMNKLVYINAVIPSESMQDTIMLAGTYAAEKNNNWGELQTANASYYSLLSSDELDTLVTSLELNHNLQPDSLTIGEPVTQSLTYYTASENAGQSAAPSAAASAFAGDDDSDGDSITADTADTTAQGNAILQQILASDLILDYDQPGYYRSVAISFCCTGEDSDFLSMLDDMAANYPSVQLVSFSIDTRSFADTDGSAVTATAFNVSLNVILCDKGGVQP